MVILPLLMVCGVHKMKRFGKYYSVIFSPQVTSQLVDVGKLIGLVIPIAPISVFAVLPHERELLFNHKEIACLSNCPLRFPFYHQRMAQQRLNPPFASR